MGLQDDYIAAKRGQEGLIPEGCNDVRMKCGFAETRQDTYDYFKNSIEKWKAVFAAISKDYPENALVKAALESLNSLQTNSPEYQVRAALRNVSAADDAIIKDTGGRRKKKGRKTKRRGLRRRKTYRRR